MVIISRWHLREWNFGEDSYTGKRTNRRRSFWEKIAESVAVIAELFSLDQKQVLSQILFDNRKLEAMRDCIKLLPKLEESNC